VKENTTITFIHLSLAKLEYFVYFLTFVIVQHPNLNAILLLFHLVTRPNFNNYKPLISMVILITAPAQQTQIGLSWPVLRLGIAKVTAQITAYQPLLLKYKNILLNISTSWQDFGFFF